MDLWIIERRYLDNGRLDLAEPQPETFFGAGAVHGMTEDAIAKRIFSKYPDAVLTGDSIARWPSIVDPHFVARRKTW